MTTERFDLKRYLTEVWVYQPPVGLTRVASRCESRTRGRYSNPMGRVLDAPHQCNRRSVEHIGAYDFCYQHAKNINACLEYMAVREGGEVSHAHR
jgi:hypothetical protein